MPMKNKKNRYGLLVRNATLVVCSLTLALFTTHFSAHAKNTLISSFGNINANGRLEPSKLEKNNSDSQTVLIHFDADTPIVEVEKTIAEANGTLLNWNEAIHVAVVQINSSSSDDVNGQSLLGTNDTVEYIEADGWVYGMYEPDDPDLYNTDRVYTAELLNLFDAWSYTAGDPDVVIAVLDTGITFEHPEFEDKVLPGYDFFNKDDDPSDDHGHGTHVAGTSAANFDNGIGSAGVCPKCSILPVKVLNQNNAGTWSGVAAGVTYAADEGANIIVMSLGSVAGTKTIEAAIEYAVEKGVLIFAASGNINTNRNFYPAAYPGVVGVAATDKNDLRWALSNYGDYVDISAPGHLIYGAHKDLDNQYDGHSFMSGTSMATPHVAGLAGLLWSQDMSRSSHEIERLIYGTALDLGTEDEDDYFGHGRIDPATALEIGSAMPGVSQLSGVTWQDTNADGVQDPDETNKIPNVLIGLKNLITDETIFIRSNNRGFWQLPNASAGNYKITLVEDGLIHTTQDKVIKVVGQQTINLVNIGVTNELPDTVLSGIDAERDDSHVTLSWQIDSELVSKIVVERAIGDSGYQIVGQNVAGTALIDMRVRSEFVDVLPVGADESQIAYRLVILPGESYIEGITVQPQNARTSALFPMIIR